MTRGTIIVTAVATLVGLAVAVGIVVAATGQKDDGDPAKHERTAPETEDQANHGLDDAERSARAFLAGYLPLIYGRQGASVERIRAANGAVLSQLRADPGRVPPAQAQASYKLTRVTVLENRPGDALATATVQNGTPGAPAYPINLRLSDTPGRGWQVYRLGP